MNNRCLHELKTTLSETAAEKIEMTDGSKSIQETELGQSVLTLTEALLTFVTESEMFNLKLSKSNGEYRTVILKKH